MQSLFNRTVEHSVLHRKMILEYESQDKPRLRSTPKGTMLNFQFGDHPESDSTLSIHSFPAVDIPLSWTESTFLKPLEWR